MIFVDPRQYKGMWLPTTVALDSITIFRGIFETTSAWLYRCTPQHSTQVFPRAYIDVPHKTVHNFSGGLSQTWADGELSINGCKHVLLPGLNMDSVPSCVGDVYG